MRVVSGLAKLCADHDAEAEAIREAERGSRAQLK